MDKAAWCWVDSTEPKYVSKQHMELAYRIKLDVCRPNSCRYVYCSIFNTDVCIMMLDKKEVVKLYKVFEIVTF